MTDVIVLAYNSQNLIQKTLFSIAYQENVKDLNVYIVNNKSKIDYSNEVKFFNQFMNIKELKITQKLSQGLARQYAIEHSKSEFIMFIDPGDTFASPIATKILQKKITKEKADIVESAFYDIFNYEKKNPQHNDKNRLYGKIYRRKYLINNKIKFKDTFEDEGSIFNILIYLHKAKIKRLEDFTYLHDVNCEINNRKSIISKINNYIDNIIWTLNQAIETNCSKILIARYAFSSLVSMYYYYIEFIEEKRVNELLKNSIELYDICVRYPVQSGKERQSLFYEQFYYQFNDEDRKYYLNPIISFTEFMDLIKEEI